MAKVLKGGVRADKNDPLQRYGNYKSGKTVIRRAIHPEYFMHSWSREVKENRDVFAKAMETYSKLDIVTKQAYTEAIYLNPKAPIGIIGRRAIDVMRRRWKNKHKPGVLPLPSYVPLPWIVPGAFPLPNPYISPEPWPWTDYQPWPNERSVGGHQQKIRDDMARKGIRDPTRSPVPGDIPLPGPEPSEDRTPQRNPVIITIEIDPEGLLGKSWDLYVSVRSEYTKVERWISSHKKEVIIIVAFGTLLLLTYSFVVGGLTLEAGSELLVTPAAEKLYPIGALMMPNVSIKHIKDRYYKLIKEDLIKQLNIWAQNVTRGWICYQEKEEDEYGFTYYIYTGPREDDKGELAADVSVFIDWDKGEASIIPHCYSPKDTVQVYLGERPFFWCGEFEPRLAPPWLWNYTKGHFGECRHKIGKGYILFEFEDRPVYGDGDYNDAYFKLWIDDQWNILGWEAIEGKHCDELGVFWLGIEWGHFNKRC